MVSTRESENGMISLWICDGAGGKDFSIPAANWFVEKLADVYWSLHSLPLNIEKFSLVIKHVHVTLSVTWKSHTICLFMQTENLEAFQLICLLRSSCFVQMFQRERTILSAWRPLPIWVMFDCKNSVGHGLFLNTSVVLVLFGCGFFFWHMRNISEPPTLNVREKIQRQNKAF